MRVVCKASPPQHFSLADKVIASQPWCPTSAFSCSGWNFTRIQRGQQMHRISALGCLPVAVQALLPTKEKISLIASFPWIMEALLLLQMWFWVPILCCLMAKQIGSGISFTSTLEFVPKADSVISVNVFTLLSFRMLLWDFQWIFCNFDRIH